MRKFLFLVFSLLQFSLFGQTASNDADKVFLEAKSILTDCKISSNHEKFRDLLYNLILHTQNSKISLKNLRELIKESEELIAANEDLRDLDYLLKIIKAIVEDYLGSHANYLAILTETSEKLTGSKSYAELINFNLELAHFSVMRGYKEEAKKFYYNNEALWKYGIGKSSNPRIKFRPIENANSLGVFYFKENELDSAEYFYRLGIERARGINEKTWLGIISGNLGNVLFKKGNIDSAEKYLLIDRQYSIESGVYTSAINAIFILIDLKIEQKNYGEANKLLAETKVLLEKTTNAEKDFYPNFDIKYETRLAKLMFQKAEINDAMRLFYQVIDVLEERNKQQSIEAQKPDHKRYAIEENVLKIEALEEQRNQNRFMLLLVVLFFVFACIFIYIQLRFSKKLKLKNAEIAQQAKDLAELNAQKNKLFSILSHDLRSPLGNLFSLLEMQREGDIDVNEFQKFIPIVSNSLKSLSATLENLLSWTKIGMENGIQMHATFVDLKLILAETIFQIQPALDAKNMKIKIDNKFAGLALADASLLVIVLRNLLMNAIKFSHNGKEVIVEVAAKPNTKNIVLIRVIDHGVGMTDEIVQGIFSVKTNYVQSKGTNGEEGSGLGLIICKEFTEAMGGRIFANSILEVGSTFVVELPSKNVSA